MSHSIRNLLRELRTGLVAIYGDRLNGVYLFGSYARKEADPESDVDVFVVLDRIDRYTQEVATTSPLISRLSLQHGVSVSRVFVSQLDWADRPDAVPRQRWRGSNPCVSDPARALLAKADRAIHAAEVLLKGSDADVAIGRAS